MTDGANAIKLGDGADGDVGATPAVRDGGSVGQRSGDVVRLQSIRLPSAPATETTVLLGMIERASSDLTFDIDRLEKMYSLYERAAARSAKSAYIDALMRAKAALPRVIKTGSASYVDRSTKEKTEAFKYAKWEEVCTQIEPILAANGLVLTFQTEQPAADRVSIIGILSHRDGHSERAEMALGCDASGGKNNAQGWGSAISYGKRYTSFALLNLVGHDDKDTDAALPEPEAITEDQAIQIRDWLESTNTEQADFLKYFGAESVAKFPAAKFDAAIAAFKKKAGKK